MSFALAICLADARPAAHEPVVKLPDYRVQGNPVEDFGFRVSPAFDVARSGRLRKVHTPVVDLVLPNTAAAKAGLRPGDRIVLADGEPTDSTASLAQWRSLQRKKWKEARETDGGVDWVLHVEDVHSGEARTVTLRLPTPAPRWGGPVWQAPEGRPAARVTEAGPLAERAREVLDHGIWMILRRSYVDGFGMITDAEQPSVLGYQWTLWDERGGHRLFVTRQRGRTDIVLEFIAEPNHAFGRERAPTESPDPTLASERTTLGNKAWAYHTSPAGELRAAFNLARREALAPAHARAGFEAELEFWLRRVGKVSARWPLEKLEPARGTPSGSR